MPGYRDNITSRIGPSGQKSTKKKPRKVGFDNRFAQPSGGVAFTNPTIGYDRPTYQAYNALEEGSLGNEAKNRLLQAYATLVDQGKAGGSGDKGPASDTMPVKPGDKNSGSGIPNDPWSGFAKDYTAGGMDIIYDNPDIIVRDRLKQMGLNPNDGLMDLLSQDAGALQMLAMLGLGSGADSANTQTDENFLNFGGDWVASQMTPGAGSMDLNQMLSSILDSKEGSAIKAFLESGTPQQQAQALNMLVDAATMGMTPAMQRAAGQVLQDRTTDWLSAKSKGEEGMLADWLQRGGNGIWG